MKKKKHKKSAGIYRSKMAGLEIMGRLLIYKSLKIVYGSVCKKTGVMGQD